MAKCDNWLQSCWAIDVWSYDSNSDSSNDSDPVFPYYFPINISPLMAFIYLKCLRVEDFNSVYRTQEKVDSFVRA